MALGRCVCERGSGSRCRLYSCSADALGAGFRLGIGIAALRADYSVQMGGMRALMWAPAQAARHTRVSELHEHSFESPIPQSLPVRGGVGESGCVIPTEPL